MFLLYEMTRALRRWPAIVSVRAVRMENDEIVLFHATPNIMKDASRRSIARNNHAYVRQSRIEHPGQQIADLNRRRKTVASRGF